MQNMMELDALAIVDAHKMMNLLNLAKDVKSIPGTFLRR